MKKLSTRRSSSTVLKPDAKTEVYIHFDALWEQHLPDIRNIYNLLYRSHPSSESVWLSLKMMLRHAMTQRSSALRSSDKARSAQNGWFLSNQLAGMSLYVDRFAKDLQGMSSKLDYLQDLGINLLHLMPIFQSPAGESDGGYAVSDFRNIDSRFGTLEDLRTLVADMNGRGMYVMLDIVLNHTSDQHEWARLARSGDTNYQDYYYMYDDRSTPDRFDQDMPEIFPESSPGNFTYIPECNKWVMSVFHHYQWDLNFSNPMVLVDMIDNILFYANLGVDILRIDAPAFIWKQPGTNCQNLPEAHEILRLIKHCVQIVAPGVALLGEAIVSPVEIMKYFGTGLYTARECDFAYNATLMALQWDALATGKTRILKFAQAELLAKPLGVSWISYTRCHDDIGLGFSDDDIRRAGFDAFAHRHFLKEYYSGSFSGSPASGALFSVNTRTNDARISGTLASLCGLEKAMLENNQIAIHTSIAKIILMQAHSFFIGGLPMLFYGDEVGYTNDYSYSEDRGKAYDNRWMHRPMIDWGKNMLHEQSHTIEGRIFNATQKLLTIRRLLPAIADHKNITWLPDENIHLSAFMRYSDHQQVFCLFNFGAFPIYLSWYIFKEFAVAGTVIVDHWSGQELIIGSDQEHFVLPGYGILIASGSKKE